MLIVTDILRTQGKCQSADNGLFFPEKYSEAECLEAAQALYCNDCPVAELCDGYAVVHKEWGIWGGRNVRDRDRLSPIRRLRIIRRYRQLYSELSRPPQVEQPSVFSPSAPPLTYADPT
jgi:hypothetical protein